MIRRIWRGSVARADAERYERLLRGDIARKIVAMRVPGFRGMEVLRRTDGGADEVEFATVMTFDSEADIRAFAGNDPTTAYVPERARTMLSRWDEHCRHYEV